MTACQVRGKQHVNMGSLGSEATKYFCDKLIMCGVRWECVTCLSNRNLHFWGNRFCPRQSCSDTQPLYTVPGDWTVREMAILHAPYVDNQCVHLGCQGRQRLKYNQAEKFKKNSTGLHDNTMAASFVMRMGSRACANKQCKNPIYQNQGNGRSGHLTAVTLNHWWISAGVTMAAITRSLRATLQIEGANPFPNKKTSSPPSHLPAVDPRDGPLALHRLRHV